MIQRNATVTSCTFIENQAEAFWRATGTLERYGYEVSWSAHKGLHDTEWDVSANESENSEEESSELVLSGEPSWRMDILSVLKPYPPTQ
tara:strand:- start:384 stop:650 length:267 start_codon:yes stop_codon:yes gene_type:complete